MWVSASVCVCVCAFFFTQGLILAFWHLWRTRLLWAAGTFSAGSLPSLCESKKTAQFFVLSLSLSLFISFCKHNTHMCVQVCLFFCVSLLSLSKINLEILKWKTDYVSQTFRIYLARFSFQNCPQSILIAYLQNVLWCTARFGSCLFQVGSERRNESTIIAKTRVPKIEGADMRSM